MHLLDAIRLALAQIRVQKLKSFFTLLGVTIGVMFLIAVVSIVEGMGKYVEEDFIGRFLGANTFTFRRWPDFDGPESEAEWRAMQRWPLVYKDDARFVVSTLPPGMRWAIETDAQAYASTPYARPALPLEPLLARGVVAEPRIPAQRERVRAEQAAREVVLHVLRHAFDDRDDRDQEHDADHDAEQGEEALELLDADLLQREADGFEERHYVIPSVSSRKPPSRHPSSLRCSG